MTQFAVIIPAYQAEDTLKRCLDGVVQAGFTLNEITVVDDASTDRTAAIARQYGVAVLTNATTLRPAAARNRGVYEVDADILVFVDADVVLNGNIREPLSRHFERPSLTAVIGSYDDRSDGGSVVSDYRNLLHHHVHQQSGGASRTFWTGIGAVRRKAFLEAGGLRTEWENIEDVEFGLRLTAAGGEILLDPTLQGTHLKVWTPTSMFRTDLTGRAIPWSRLIMSRRAAFGALNTSSRHQVSAAGLVLALFGVLAAVAWPPIWPVIGIGLLVFLLGASDVFRTLAEKRGTVFALRSIPWHAVYCTAASLGYARVRCEALINPGRFR